MQRTFVYVLWWPFAFSLSLYPLVSDPNNIWPRIWNNNRKESIWNKPINVMLLRCTRVRTKEGGKNAELMPKLVQCRNFCMLVISTINIACEISFFISLHSTDDWIKVIPKKFRWWFKKHFGWVRCHKWRQSIFNLRKWTNIHHRWSGINLTNQINRCFGFILNVINGPVQNDMVQDDGVGYKIWTIKWS